MRSVRSLTAVVLAAALATTSTLSGCATQAAPLPPDDGRPVVLATFTVLADLAAQVAGEDAVVVSLTGPGTEIHGYEPSPEDLRRAAGADLVIANGLGLEGWVDGLLEPLDVPRLVLGEAAGLGTETAPDPHAWMSPVLGARYVRAVGDALADLDPAHAADYRARAEAYAREVAGLGAQLKERLEPIPPERRLLVTCEGAFGHLGDAVGLRTASLWPVNAERQATPRRVAAVVDLVRETGVPAVFCESTVPSTAAEQVARETGARFAGVLYVDSLSGPQGPVPTYLDLLRYDADLIADALGGVPPDEAAGGDG